MNRKYNILEYKKKIEELRSIREDINITTDLIVGFPEETDEDFIETLKNIKDIGFSKIHTFPFSLPRYLSTRKTYMPGSGSGAFHNHNETWDAPSPSPILR